MDNGQALALNGSMIVTHLDSSLGGARQRTRRSVRQESFNSTATLVNNQEGLTMISDRGAKTKALQFGFVISAGAVLAITGVAKAFSAIGNARVLDTIDPLIGVPFRQLFFWVGLAELLITFFCLFTAKRRLSLLLVAWISTNFLVYRIGLWFIGWHHPCGCMGSLAGMLHLSDGAADGIMKGVLAFLLAGSYLLLLPEKLGLTAKNAKIEVAA